MISIAIPPSCHPFASRPMGLIVATAIAVIILTAFVFLPDTGRILRVSVAQADRVGIIFRLLLNIRYKIIAILHRGKPQYSLDITKIYVYPFKSCSYIDATEWEVDEFGLKHDRQYMAAWWDEKHGIYQPYTLHHAPRFSLVKINYNLEENWFEFVYPILDAEGNNNGYKSFKLPCEITQQFVDDNVIRTGDHRTNMWTVHFDSYDVGRALPEEFKESMNLKRHGTTLLVTSKAKLVRTGHPSGSLSEMRATKFQDYYPLKFLAQEEIALLNEKMIERGFTRQVKPLQFRPNIAVHGLRSDQSIDDWYQFRIESHGWTVAQKCKRCIISNVKLDEGVFDKQRAAYSTLETYRKIDAGSKHGQFLGQYAIHHSDGYTIKVGDKMHLLQEKVQLYQDLE